MNLHVDWRVSVALVGRLVKWLSVPLLLPLGVALYYGDGGVLAFTVTIAVAFLLGSGLERLSDTTDIGTREAFLMVGLSWFAVSLVGAIPYLVNGYGTTSTLAHPVNALFESMSGFTTTGATVMGDISFEQHGHGLLIWRQLTQWLGGMGIVVLAVAILPELSVGGAQLMDAEAPGPGIQKLTPRIAETARALWKAYVGITILEILLLYSLHVAGMAPNMTFYNAVAHGLTTLSTGGFSPEARSIEAFSSVVQWVIIPFMVAAGTNFALFHHVLRGEADHLWRDTEFRAYVGVIGVGSAIAAGVLFTDPGLLVVEGVDGAIAGNPETSLRQATFQVVAIVTTTGYASMDFNAWSPTAQYLLLFGMFIGGSAGSTGGGVKIVRWLVMLKVIKRELFSSVHPDAVTPVRLGGRPLDEDAIRGIFGFAATYAVLFFLGTLVVSLIGADVEGGLQLLDAASAVAATLGNIGPGFGMVGPMNSYLPFPDSSKLIMVGFMWAGRLEILPVLVLFTDTYWRG